MRKPWTIALVLAVVTVTLLLLWPTQTYDLAKAHPALRDLPKPYRSVGAHYYLDGGSIGVEVVGADGTRLKYAFPVKGDDSGQSYPQLFVGGLFLKQKPGEPPLSEITNIAPTKAIILEILRHGQGPDTDLALVRLRGSPADYARLCWNIFRDKFLNARR